MKNRIYQSNLQRWRLCYCHQSGYKDANDPNRDSQPKQGSCLIKEVEQTILSKSINIVEDSQQGRQTPLKWKNIYLITL